jgi:AmiR/NasT family two-component response regulator
MTAMAGADQARRRRHEACLAALDLLVVTPRNPEGELLLRELQRTRARVRHVWPVPELIPDDVDVVFTELMPDLPRRLPWVPGQPKAALVVLLPNAAISLDLLHNCAPDALLQRPFAAHAIPACLLQAHTRFTYEMRMRARIDKLDETLRGIRTIERAKTILVQTRNIGEDAAYTFIRRQAMDRRVTINSVATKIIDSYDLLG